MITLCCRDSREPPRGLVFLLIPWAQALGTALGSLWPAEAVLGAGISRVTVGTGHWSPHTCAVPRCPHTCAIPRCPHSALQRRRARARPTGAAPGLCGVCASPAPASPNARVFPP